MFQVRRSHLAPGRLGGPSRGRLRAWPRGWAEAALCAVVSVGGVGAAHAEVTRVSAGAFPISSVVSAPAAGRLVWVSGTTAPPPAAGGSMGDTKTQTVATLKKISELLAGQGLSLGDVTMMRVYLVADPALGKMDFTGMMAGYTQFFGTSAQPNKPSRTTVQVAGLAGPGALVEIEVQAIKS